MAYLDGVLLGFVCGLAAGLFLAYKIAQHSNNKGGRQQPPLVDPSYNGQAGLVWPEDKKRLK